MIRQANPDGDVAELSERAYAAYMADRMKPVTHTPKTVGWRRVRPNWMLVWIVAASASIGSLATLALLAWIN